MFRPSPCHGILKCAIVFLTLLTRVAEAQTADPAEVARALVADESTKTAPTRRGQCI